MKRCDECGSWDAQCSSDTPVKGCGCARCANAELAVLRKDAARYQWLRDTANKTDIEDTILSGLAWHKMDAVIDAAIAGKVKP